MKKTTAPIPFAGSQLGQTRHVCAFFNSADEEYRVLLPFIKDGFQCGHKAIHVVNPDQRQDILKASALHLRLHRSRMVRVSRGGKSLMTEDNLTISSNAKFREAMILAIIADALQIVIFPLFAAGAMSPADDVLDLGVGALMIHLLGFHWEFLPSFFAKLVPGVDLFPFWTLAVANVYRRSKRIAQEAEQESHPALKQG